MLVWEVGGFWVGLVFGFLVGWDGFLLFWLIVGGFVFRGVIVVVSFFFDF